jgi:hypothetical protein
VRRPSFEQIVKSLTAYHKNLKKVMSFTSDSVESSESENSATSEDELGTLPIDNNNNNDNNK